MKLDHTNRAHAKLSASGAKQWLNCPPSIKASEGIGDRTSIFAEEGTFAHELSELYFSHKYGGLTEFEFNKAFSNYQHNEYYSEELREYVEQYVDMVEERVNEAKARDKDVITMFETRLDLGKYVPESFGTGDVIVYAGGVLEIIDLKFGKGVEVSAVNNPQLRLYGLGAYELLSVLEEVHAVKMTIIQPRIDNFSTEKMDAKMLVAWGTDYVKPRAELAFKGEGEFKAGEHCMFCKIKHSCRARSEFMQDVPNTPAHLLNDDEIAELLYKVPAIKKWAEEVESYALGQMLEHGKSYAGWKLVEGRSRRVITDTQAVQDRLVKEGYKVENITETKLLSITNLEKLVGKKAFNELAGNYIDKPPGKVTLAKETDKRKAIIQSVEDEFDKI
ncbi:TPA: DUF2800 domain-containing protein [Staphylococcus pseudintermedius]|uniref:DUF2800 domain-containing protein n=1 Tax=Staphylococcus pseudintermedius TaxID=283734 RepID=UPI001BDEA633|nr:DUF2800 domain-containing protein [Staphylococcus pseudintermedius]HAR6193145.1 DUF2800 domain-containing protein [Staphylococcus pseudintermedius]